MSVMPYDPSPLFTGDQEGPRSEAVQHPADRTVDQGAAVQTRTAEPAAGLEHTAGTRGFALAGQPRTVPPGPEAEGGVPLARVIPLRPRQQANDLQDREAGMATAEYAIATLAAVAFAALLVAVLSSGDVREMLMSLIRAALSFG
ncbi:DUF4244 domain-containing protein [Arthrobacter luteolus]|uniref:DUF4244 domain-containing protein n=1 Tax=Arthrobacter luteolus TaxID=98672 RepID=UPI00384C07F4